ncbi:MAG: SatD family protein [Methanomassiliicoccaceae archaeon]|nr:SatD family protein [Methanomassiliicoccaceae archaeon]
MTNTALILDIKGSKNMSNDERAHAQEKLYDIINIINSVYREKIKYKLEFSGGDGVEGSFADPSSAIRCYTFIMSAFHPYVARCGIGIGDLVEMPYESSNMADGPSYHRANDALSLAKARGYELLFMSDGEGDRFINQYLTVAQMLLSGQSQKQRIVNNIVFLLDPLTFPGMDMIGYRGGAGAYIEESAGSYGQRPDGAAGAREKDVSGAYPEFGRYKFDALGNGEAVFDECLPFDVRRLYTKKYGDEALMGRTIDGKVQTAIGRMLGVSSENVRQMINKGHVDTIRSLFISASAMAVHFSER